MGAQASSCERASTYESRRSFSGYSPVQLATLPSLCHSPPTFIDHFLFDANNFLDFLSNAFQTVGHKLIVGELWNWQANSQQGKYIETYEKWNRATHACLLMCMWLCLSSLWRAGVQCHQNGPDPVNRCLQFDSYFTCSVCTLPRGSVPSYFPAWV